MQERAMASLSPIESLITDLEADRARLALAVERVPPSLRSMRAEPERWSVAEILEHLAIVEQRAITIVNELAAAAPPSSDAPGASGPFAFDRSVLRDRTRRVSAPAPIQPTGRLDAAQAWSMLEHSRTALIAAIRAAEGRDLAAVTRTHPRLGPLTGHEWIAALGGHEERHAAQIEELADALTSSTAVPPPA
jgi:hypothetical protein